jgi:hypothetical protein
MTETIPSKNLVGLRPGSVRPINQEISMHIIDRHAMMAGATVVPLASLAALASKESATDDSKLRRLWSEYLEHAAAYSAAGNYDPAWAVFDTESPPCPDNMSPGQRWRACQWLWHKHGLGPLTDAWNAAAIAMRETVEGILTTEAMGLFGIGVKLAATQAQFSDPDDYENTIAAVCKDIGRLLGGDFAERFAARNDEFADHEEA